MFADYLITSFPTLTIVLVLCAAIFTNRNTKIPAARFFNTAVLLLLFLSVLDYIELTMSQATAPMPSGLNLAERISIRFVAGTLLYVLRPFVVWLEVLAMAPGQKSRLFVSIPVVMNALLYMVSFFTTHFVFQIDENNHFHGTPHLCFRSMPSSYSMWWYCLSSHSFVSGGITLI